MKTIMNDSHIETLEQVRQFLRGVAVMEITIPSKNEGYRWIQGTLVRFQYLSLGKTDRGLIRRYLQQISGYSRAQIARLIKQYRKTGRIQRRQRTVKGFTSKYTRQDIRLLARLDELHGTLSGPATKKLCERAWQVFKQAEYQRLAGISVSHLYNLRESTPYARQRGTVNKTHPVQSHIGERRKPRPEGRPGYIRVDTVHQGDWDGTKGVYHVNAVDEITQFEGVASVERISERYLIPALKFLIDSFPFIVKGFHADNGSEYINKRVADLLNKLLIELTKSRSRRTNDNALVESKNGSIVRKHLGYHHIPQKWAPLINEFNQKYLNPYINYHRPCFFPIVKIDAKGKQKKTYPYKAMMTPYEKFKSIPEAKQYLKPGMTFKRLHDIALSISDNEAAHQLNEARKQL
ncbi:MAG: transposase family protein, partial [Gammaproteobacteria bacterium]|nr:transposase family protein [Gammaproteobacteria bacterium]